jgi:acetoin utilization deacetylase AcuC-like enzyme
MQTIFSPAHTLHDPPFEIIDGQIATYYEMPRRVTIILDAMREAGFAAPQTPREFGLEPVLAVHQPEYIAYLERAYAEWVAAGKPPEALLPSTLPLGGMQARSRSPVGEAGRYIFDLSAPIIAGTYAAARASADCALTAADLLLGGERVAYALCRPPGHHAMPAMAGGYCYLNNAAIAANYLSLQSNAALPLPLPTTAWNLPPATVGLLDIDFHHGNGSQAIFYQRSDVFFVSLHGDPDREYPYYAGYADEQGDGAGEGYNLNIPLPAATDDNAYLSSLDKALSAIAAYSPRYLVVSLGLDTFAGDPLGDLALTTAGFGHIGAAIAQLGLPTLFVQEGGYAIDALGANLVALMTGFLYSPDLRTIA